MPADPIEYAAFDFETASMENLRRLMYEEILHYHSKKKKSYHGSKKSAGNNGTTYGWQ